MLAAKGMRRLVALALCATAAAQPSPSALVRSATALVDDHLAACSAIAELEHEDQLRSLPPASDGAPACFALRRALVVNSSAPLVLNRSAHAAVVIVGAPDGRA